MPNNIPFHPTKLFPNEGASLIAQAMKYGSKKHRFIRRKGNGIPYFMHLAETAQMVALGTGGDVIAIIAAILHDVIEDTPTRHMVIAGKFGKEVADIVDEVSHDPGEQTSEQKKQRQIEKFPTLSLRAKIVKMADKYSNSDYSKMPDNWDTDKRRDNLNAAAKIFELGEGVCPFIEVKFWERHSEAMLLLEQDIKAGRFKPEKKPVAKSGPHKKYVKRVKLPHRKLRGGPKRPAKIGAGKRSQATAQKR